MRFAEMICAAAAGVMMLAIAGPATASRDRDGSLPVFGTEALIGSSLRSTREVVKYAGNHPAGTIVVDTIERKLYHVLDDGKAVRYGVGVGRPGFEWGGQTRISRKAEWPGWTPPPAMRKRQPYLPAYMPGGPQNPLGARALYLGSSIYRIHGTNEANTIGDAVSSGCIRMLNDDVIDLYNSVEVGARVVVVR